MTDTRPICNCSAYPFPHKIGGKCKGTAFVQAYRTFSKEHCEFCNCLYGNTCEVLTGQESIKQAECYLEALETSRYLKLTLEDYL